MATLHFPKTNKTIEKFSDIKSYLNTKGVLHEQWIATKEFSETANQEEILSAYEKDLKPYMLKFGYATADVITVNHLTPNIEAIREKFLPEHTHTEDEVRFFVDGEGIFWFNFEDEVASLTCRRGDLISVPKNYKHWFDLGSKPFVKAIRLFIDPSGWVAHYTHSGIDKNFNPQYL